MGNGSSGSIAVASKLGTPCRESFVALACTWNYKVNYAR